MPKLNSPQSFFLRKLPVGWMMHRADFQPNVVQRLMELMKDDNVSNRDWATFLLSQSSHNSPQIIKALIRNASDNDAEISSEAILGLAQRQRVAARRLVLEKLTRRSLDVKDIEAAGYVGHQSLVPSLNRVSRWWQSEEELIGRAISSCRYGKPKDYGFC